ncbi:hypothetical protein O6H91_11G076500 [Diphasiastrum complanatum]|uniref:Uncharacterized protein n=1 Tax=Diphasiastrum complanatum TaxID=34168 RepID=A0ACC2CAM0_DIPCM|nr:hypothetical protein O6H91_11G076500 [Diphasiastrum complanatum]
MQTHNLQSPAPETIEWGAHPLPQSQPKIQTSTYNRPSDATANAVSFGFIATAILISIFLVVAIFERLLRYRPPSDSVTTQQNTHLELSGVTGTSLRIEKPDEQKSEIDYAKGVSVLMPGQVIPSYIARPVPFPGSPEVLH